MMLDPSQPALPNLVFGNLRSHITGQTARYPDVPIGYKARRQATSRFPYSIAVSHDAIYPAECDLHEEFFRTALFVGW